MTQRKVLLIDDEVEFIETLAERLSDRGFKVQTATSGQAGISKAESTNFDAVVLDLAMPGMDGIATLKRLREIRPSIQVMLLSGQATIKAAVDATQLGAVDILEKPMDIQTLVEKINEASERHFAAEEKQAEDQAAAIAQKKGW